MPLDRSCASVSCNATSAGNPTPGTRLQLPLERIAMDIDDARKHQQAARVEFRSTSVAADTRDAPVLDREVHHLLAVGTQQNAAAGDAQHFHDFLSHGSKTIWTRGVG